MSNELIGADSHLLSAYELGRMLSSQETASFQPPRAQVTEIITVPTSEHVAQIVGKNGYKIKKLRDHTKTCIRTPLRGDQPVFKVTGSPDNVRTVANAIQQASDHFTELMRSRSSACAIGEVTILVEVPQNYIGVVVGRNGSQILKIKEQTRTRINTPKSDSSQPAFEVTGTKMNVEAAREAILDRVRDALNIKNSMQFDPDLQHKSMALDQSKVMPPLQPPFQPTFQQSFGSLPPPPGYSPTGNLSTLLSRPMNSMLSLQISPLGLDSNYFQFSTVENDYNKSFANIFDN